MLCNRYKDHFYISKKKICSSINPADRLLNTYYISALICRIVHLDKSMKSKTATETQDCFVIHYHYVQDGNSKILVLH